MSDFTIVSNAQTVLAAWRTYPRAMQQAALRGLVRGLLLAEQTVRAGASLRFSGSRAGLLSRLTSYSATTPRGGLYGVIGFRRTRGFPYELSQEFGAKAKAGGAMAIPVSREAKLLGQRNVTARDFPRPLFRPPNTHVLAESGRHKWANQFGRGDSEFQVHYVLVKSISPRLNFRNSVIASIDTIANQVVTEVAHAR